MIIGEFGNTFCDSIGITRNTGLIDNNRVSVLDTKSNIYAKLGITGDVESLPEIIILRNLESVFSFGSSLDEDNKANLKKLNDFGFDLLIINNEIYTSFIDDQQDNLIRTNSYISNHTKDINAKVIKFTIMSNTYIYMLKQKDNTTTYGISICGYDSSINFSEYQSFTGHRNANDINNMKKGLVNKLSIGVKKCIKSLLNRDGAHNISTCQVHQHALNLDDHLCTIDKPVQISVANRDKVQVKLDKLQSKIMEFFEIPDQSQRINELEQENAKLQSRIDGYQSRIHSHELQIDEYQSRIDEYKKSADELVELKNQLKQLID